MNSLSITNFVKSTNCHLCVDYFNLEKLCFPDNYKIRPSNKSDFDSMFKYKCHIISAHVKSKLVGMAFLDLLGESIIYLRVICTHPDYCNRGISSLIINNIKTIMINNDIKYIAFVSRTDKLINMFCKESIFLCDHIPDDIRIMLHTYNPKVKEYQPGTYMPKYYELNNGSFEGATYYLLRRQ